MQLKLTRRQFGQFAIFSTTVAALGTVINQTLAQETNTDPVILGIKTGLSDNYAPTNLNSDIIDPSEETQITQPSPLQPLIVESLNVNTQEIQTVLTTPPILETCERLSGFASIKGKLIAAASYTCTRKKKDKKVRLIDLDSLESVNLSGLKNNEDLYQLMRLANGSLGGLVGKEKGKGFSRIVTIDLNTGQITERRKVPEQKRVTAVAESSGGSLYGINTNKFGEINLSQIGQEQSTILKYRGIPLNDGCDGLVWTPSNELFALVAFRYESPKYVYRINRSTGEIERIQGFDVAKIALE